MTLTNESEEELRFQISASQWSQDASGNMQLKPTEDIVFFPSLLSLKPKEERKVRLATAVKPGEQERTYRIFFEELPPISAVQKEKNSQVRILTKIGVPVFVGPVERKPAGDIAGFSADEGKISFDVRNGGNVHYMAQKIRIVGLDAGGKPIFEKEQEGWYVLAGSTRHYSIELKPSECPNVRSVQIEVQTDLTARPESSTLTGDFKVAEPHCAKSK